MKREDVASGCKAWTNLSGSARLVEKLKLRRPSPGYTTGVRNTVRLGGQILRTRSALLYADEDASRKYYLLRNLWLQRPTARIHLPLRPPTSRLCPSSM